MQNRTSSKSSVLKIRLKYQNSGRNSAPKYQKIVWCQVVFNPEYPCKFLINDKKQEKFQNSCDKQNEKLSSILEIEDELHYFIMGVQSYIEKEFCQIFPKTAYHNIII